MFGAIFALALVMQADAPAPDVIGDILARPPPAAGPAAPAPLPAAPPSIASKSTPEPNGRTLHYEAGVRSSFQAREARQGPLDGRWTLAGADGKALYLFQLADPGPGRGPVEGAWRDLDRQGVVGASGFLARAERSGQDLVLTFQEPALAQSCVVTLVLGGDGRWTGQIRLSGQAGQARPVVMTRS